MLSVPHDGDIVGNALDFRHFVRDVDDAKAPVPEHIDNLKQMFHFFLGQGRGGFVEYDDFRIVGHRFGDFHHLPLGHGHSGHNPAGVYVNAQFLKHGQRVPVHFALVHHDAAHLWIAAQPEIIHHGTFQRLIQLLMDHGDAV